MPKINVLPKEISELIAAGEVVERPSSVIKELIENSIDAGAKTITVEIRNGGITYMRVTDDGCGIANSEVPLAFLRHATSKISSEKDLDFISTLGFRGEALAAVSSVAKVEMFTKTKAENFGTHYIIEGSCEVLYDEDGCSDGTTIIIRDLFFNTPARMKFLKKDTYEGNSVAAIVDRIAISHPEISFKFIRDNKTTLTTAGDGNLKNTVYSVMGREFANALIPVDYELNGIKVNGLTCKPIFCKPSRNYQLTFLNGRFVRSGTVMAAVEQAYKNSAMVGKYPGFVLSLTIPFDSVDVNVHPAKTEVRFSDERRIFEAVYPAIKNALSLGDTRPEIKISKPVFNKFERMNVEEYRQQILPSTEIKQTKNDFSVKTEKINFNVAKSDNKSILVDKIELPDIPVKKAEVIETQIKKENISEEQLEEILLIGEAFNTYIVVQKGNSIFMIDKHAAHERILYNSLKKNIKIGVQALLVPATVTLSMDEYNTLVSNIDLLNENDFEVEDFGNGSIIIRALPSSLVRVNINDLFSEIADKLSGSNVLSVDKLDRIYHTVACRSAIKAGNITSDLERLNLAKKVLSDDEIMYCPHGRPVAFEIKKSELERQFGRLQ
ncbi:MAG: DNA mismatch repair endonuclease MutL [Clostridia bacterium]|nr:DNA mismatch repair endonuclease MutL [Clostridia bacterium]